MAAARAVAAACPATLGCALEAVVCCDAAAVGPFGAGCTNEPAGITVAVCARTAGELTCAFGADDTAADCADADVEPVTGTGRACADCT